MIRSSNNEFENIFNSNKIEDSKKINSIKSFYETSGALEYLKNKVVCKA